MWPLLPGAEATLLKGLVSLREARLARDAALGRAFAVPDFDLDVAFVMRERVSAGLPAPSPELCSSTSCTFCRIPLMEAAGPAPASGLARA